MLSDSIHDAYQAIYNAIGDYNDYSPLQRKNIIKAMTHLNMVTYALGGFKRDDFQGGYQRARSIALFDWNKAVNRVGYCSGDTWTDHDKFDIEGDKK